MVPSLVSLCLDAIARGCDQLPPNALTSDLQNALLHRCATGKGSLSLARSLTLASVLRLKSRPAPSLRGLERVFSPGLRECALANVGVESDDVAVLLRTCPLLEVLDLSGNPYLGDEPFATLSVQLPHLACLVLDECVRVTGATFAAALQCQRLVSLSCKQIRLEAAAFVFAVTSARSPLTELVLSGAKVRDTSMLVLVHSPVAATLCSLCLHYCFALSSLEFCVALPELRHLDVSGCSKITSAPRCPALLSFKAEFCDTFASLDGLSESSLTALELGHLKRLPAEPCLLQISSGFSCLRRLRVQTSHVLRDAFALALKESCGHTLVELQLHPTMLGPEGMLAVGTGFPFMEVLHLAGTWCDGRDEAFVTLARNSPRLRSLSVAKLTEPATTDEAFVACSSLANLELLDLNLHHVSDGGVLRSQLSSVRGLSLRYCRKLSGRALAHVAATCRQLQTLDLGYTTFSADDVKSLLETAVASLSFVNIVGLGISRSAVAALVRQHPGVTLYNEV